MLVLVLAGEFRMMAQSVFLPGLANQMRGWESYDLSTVGEQRLKLVKATPREHDFDVHELPETLIALKGNYAIETQESLIRIPEGAMLVVPPGVPHRPANEEECVLLVVR